MSFREQAASMYRLGYRYLISFESGITPLFVKSAAAVGIVAREQYPNERFSTLKVSSDGSLS